MHNMCSVKIDSLSYWQMMRCPYLTFTNYGHLVVLPVNFGYDNNFLLGGGLVVCILINVCMFLGIGGMHKAVPQKIVLVRL